jgi:very-short-patch-repair endonuclease
VADDPVDRVDKSIKHVIIPIKTHVLFPACSDIHQMKKHSNNFYNNRLQGFAHSLRNNLTKSEACLWKYVLRNKQMKGYTFRRQRPVMNYIADFCCLPLKLIIELDGITHHDAERQMKDEIKDKVLADKGFFVLRFSDADVLNEIVNVRQVIEDWIDEFESSYKSPPPACGHPRQRGTKITARLPMSDNATKRKL